LSATKDLILKEALSLFLEKGYYGASMRMLARRVGMQGSSLYNHFKSKQSIFSTLMEKSDSQLTSLQIEEILKKHSDCSPAETLGFVIDEICEIWFQQQGARLFLLMIRESPLFSMNVKTHSGKSIQKALEPLSLYIEELQKRGVFRADFSAGFFAWQLLAPVANLRLNYLLPNACDEDKLMGRTLIKMHLDYYLHRNLDNVP
jgi:AcrR family transcriptional regulator